MIGEISSTGPATVPTPVNPKGQLGKDEFLKMLVAQLRHQDPLSPMNADDMAAQLAQFSSLEQLTNISDAIESQAAMQEGLIASIHDTSAMNLIGKNVLAAGDQLYLPADGSGSVQFDVGGQGGLAKLRIYDQSGKQVGSRDLGFISAGRHEFEIGGAASGLEEGAYTYSIDVADAAGKPVPSQTYISATIDGVQYGSDGPVLTAGDLWIPFSTILQIRNSQ